MPPKRKRRYDDDDEECKQEAKRPILDVPEGPPDSSDDEDTSTSAEPAAAPVVKKGSIWDTSVKKTGWRCPGCNCDCEEKHEKCPACETTKPDPTAVTSAASKSSPAASVPVKKGSIWDTAKTQSSSESPAPPPVKKGSIWDTSAKKSGWCCPGCNCECEDKHPHCPACKTAKPGTKDAVDEKATPALEVAASGGFKFNTTSTKAAPTALTAPTGGFKFNVDAKASTGGFKFNATKK
eukprot:m.690437 g.690437  ORF g.690437 m.690437 type:complete len:237 (+) comp22850_c0_seq3:72-782(+)